MWPEFDPQHSLTQKPGKVVCPCNLALVETERYLELSGGPAPLNRGVPGPNGRSWLKKQSEVPATQAEDLNSDLQNTQKNKQPNNQPGLTVLRGVDRDGRSWELTGLLV